MSGILSTQPASAAKWVLPSLTLPTGTLMAGYQFAALASGDTTAVDSSANGTTITKIAGTTKIDVERFGDLRGLALDGSTYWRAANDSSFISTTAMTIELLFRKIQNSNDYAFHVGDDGSTAPKNRTALIIVKAKGAVDFIPESATGTDRTFTTSLQVTNGETMLMHLTRDTAGTEMNAYLNGTAINSTTLGAAANDGSAGTLTIGGTAAGGNLFNDTIFSLLYVDAEWSAAEVADRYAAIKVG